jgi:hypothetical protein
LKIGAKNETVLSANDTMKETMIIMALIMIALTNMAPWKEDAMRGGGGVKAFSHDLKRVRWALNFKPSGLEKDDGSTNLAEWLEVYQFTIKTAG